MNNFVVLGFLTATILLAECRTTDNMTVVINKGMETCMKGMKKEDFGSKEGPAYYKLMECVARSIKITNNHGVLNIPRLEDLVVEYVPDIPKTAIQYFIQKCTEHKGHYDGEKIVKLLDCFKATI